MKIAKVSLLALSIAAAGSVFAQAAGPNPDTLVACDNKTYNCDARVLVESNKVDHKLSKGTFQREIFSVKSRPATEKTIYIVKEEITKPSTMVVDSYYQVEPQAIGNPWAYVPK
jgi:hypothetical protein